MEPRNSRESFNHLEYLCKISTFSTFLKWPQFQFGKPLFIWQVLQLWKHACKPVLDSLQQDFIFRVIWAPYNWTVFERSDKRFIQRYQNCWIIECNRSSYETEDLISFAIGFSALLYYFQVIWENDTEVLLCSCLASGCHTCCTDSQCCSFHNVILCIFQR